MTLQRSLFGQVIFWGTAAALAFGVYSFIRSFTMCWRLTSLPGIPAADCSGQATESPETPVFADKREKPKATATPEFFHSEDITYPTWDRASRINILFVGLRGGDPAVEDCPFCTDTLILLTVDPISKTAGMLSIPRDMWVNIPGYGYSRINTAWSLGRGSRLPGGGPALTMKTVSHFIGVPVDYYVQVDFDTFIDIINVIGGVDIYNEETLFLDPIAHGKEFPKVKLTCCGTRHLNGRVALAYARCRHEEQGCKDGDVGRAKRQQKVIFAIRDKILDPQNFPGLLSQASTLYGIFSEGIHTNLSFDDALRLAVLVKDIPRESIKNAVIDNSMTIMDSTILGGQKASILRPFPDEVRLLRDQIFTSSGPLGPLARGDDFVLMQADEARIRVLNGTSSPELDKRTGYFLSQQGVPISENGNTKAVNRTTIVLYSPKLYALRFLLRTFEITSSTQILVKPDPTQTVDIEIRLGSDWVNKLPPEY